MANFSVMLSDGSLGSAVAYTFGPGNHSVCDTNKAECYRGVNLSTAPLDLKITNSSNAVNQTDFSKFEQEFQILRYVVVALYLVIFFFGLIGNTLTILVIVLNKKMKTVATCFILNLAVADDLFLLNLPLMARSTLVQDWEFGSTLCKLMTAFRSINMFASVYTMVLMSIDRFFAIKHPLKSMRYRTIRQSGWVCLGLWMACVIVVTPMWMYASTKPKTASSQGTCKTHWPSPATKSFWEYFELIIGFILPTGIMMVCYLQLIQRLVRGAGPVQDQARRPIRKVTLMVLLVTVVFVSCWTPYHIMHFLQPPNQSNVFTMIVINTVAQALANFTSCSNPFIYAISSKNFSEYYAKQPLHVQHTTRHNHIFE